MSVKSPDAAVGTRRCRRHTYEGSPALFHIQTAPDGAEADGERYIPVT